MNDDSNGRQDDSTGTPGGGTGKKKALVGGAVGLGVVGMLLLGMVVINDDGDPLDEPDPELAEAVLRDGLTDDGSPGADFGDDFDDPLGDAPLGDDVIEREDGSDVVRGDDNDDILLGDPGDDLLDGGDSSDDLLDGSDDPLLGETPNGLKRLCAEIEHTSPPGMEDTALSGIWVRGEVYGLAEGTWIWVEGPSLNNGEPTQIPVVDGGFDAPLGINSYGDHQIDRFELQVGDQPPIDLLPTLSEAIDGDAFPVGPDEGPVFDDECFDFDLPAVFTADAEPADDAVDSAEAIDLDLFFDEFAAAHVNGDSASLWDSLHPAVPQAFGDETCRSYLDDTLGSIQSAAVIEVTERGPWDFRTPDGPIPFPDAFAVDVEFTTSTGDVLPLEAHVPIEEGQLFWLTTCNVDVP